MQSRNILSVTLRQATARIVTPSRVKTRVFQEDWKTRDVLDCGGKAISGDTAFP